MSQPIARYRFLADRAPRIVLPAAASDHAIADFLAGRTHGEWVLHTLYDPALDEPTPRRLRKVIERAE